MGLMALIGLIPTAFVFVIVFMRLEGPERWKLIIPYVIVLMLGIYVAFDWFMAIPWPPSSARLPRAGERKSSLRCSSRSPIPAPPAGGGAGAQHRANLFGL